MTFFSAIAVEVIVDVPLWSEISSEVNTCTCLFQLLGELQDKQKIEENLQEELDALKESLKIERENLGKITAEHDTLNNLCDEKESALQVCVI